MPFQSTSAATLPSLSSLHNTDNNNNHHHPTGTSGSSSGGNPHRVSSSNAAVSYDVVDRAAVITLRANSLSASGASSHLLTEASMLEVASCLSRAQLDKAVLFIVLLGDASLCGFCEGLDLVEWKENLILMAPSSKNMMLSGATTTTTTTATSSHNSYNNNNTLSNGDACYPKPNKHNSNTNKTVSIRQKKSIDGAGTGGWRQRGGADRRRGPHSRAAASSPSSWLSLLLSPFQRLLRRGAADRQEHQPDEDEEEEETDGDLPATTTTAGSGPSGGGGKVNVSFTAEHTDFSQYTPTAADLVRQMRGSHDPTLNQKYGGGAASAASHYYCLSDLCGEVEGCKKFVLAALHGLTLGGGLELALSCHARISAADALFGFPAQQHLGVLPSGGGTQRLPRLVGLPAALALLTSPVLQTAETAAATGLVDALVDLDGRERRQQGLVHAAVAFGAALVREERLRGYKRQGQMTKLFSSSGPRSSSFAGSRDPTGRSGSPPTEGAGGGGGAEASPSPAGGAATYAISRAILNRVFHSQRSAQGQLRRRLSMALPPASPYFFVPNRLYYYYFFAHHRRRLWAQGTYCTTAAVQREGGALPTALQPRWCASSRQRELFELYILRALEASVYSRTFREGLIVEYQCVLEALQSAPAQALSHYYSHVLLPHTASIVAAVVGGAGGGGGGNGISPRSLSSPPTALTLAGSGAAGGGSVSSKARNVPLRFRLEYKNKKKRDSATLSLSRTPTTLLAPNGFPSLLTNNINNNNNNNYHTNSNVYIAGTNVTAEIVPPTHSPMSYLSLTPPGANGRDSPGTPQSGGGGNNTNTTTANNNNNNNMFFFAPAATSTKVRRVAVVGTSPAALRAAAEFLYEGYDVSIVVLKPLLHCVKAKRPLSSENGGQQASAAAAPPTPLSQQRWPSSCAIGGSSTEKKREDAAAAVTATATEAKTETSPEEEEEAEADATARQLALLRSCLADEEREIYLPSSSGSKHPHDVTGTFAFPPGDDQERGRAGYLNASHRSVLTTSKVVLYVLEKYLAAMVMAKASTFHYTDDAATDDGSNLDGLSGGVGGFTTPASRKSLIEYYNSQSNGSAGGGSDVKADGTAPSKQQQQQQRVLHTFVELDENEIPVLKRPFTATEVFKVQHALRQCTVLEHEPPALFSANASTDERPTFTAQTPPDDKFLEKMKDVDLLLHVRGSFLSANRHAKHQFQCRTAEAQAQRKRKKNEEKTSTAAPDAFAFYAEEDEEAYYRAVLRPFYNELNRYLKYNCIFLFDNFEVFREARNECSTFRQNRFFMMMVYHTKPFLTPLRMDEAGLCARATRGSGTEAYDERNAARLQKDEAETAFYQHLMTSPDATAWHYVGGPQVVEISTTERAPAVPALEALSDLFKTQLRQAVLFTRFVATTREYNFTHGTSGAGAGAAAGSVTMMGGAEEDDSHCAFNPISLNASQSSSHRRHTTTSIASTSKSTETKNTMPTSAAERMRLGAAPPPCATVAFSFAGLRVFARGLYQLLVLVEQQQLTLDHLEQHYFTAVATSAGGEAALGGAAAGGGVLATLQRRVTHRPKASWATPQGPLFTWQTLGLATVWAEVCQQQYHLTEAALEAERESTANSGAAAADSWRNPSCYVAALPTISLLVMEMIAHERSSFYAHPSLFHGESSRRRWGKKTQSHKAVPCSAFYTVEKEEVELRDRSAHAVSHYFFTASTTSAATSGAGEGMNSRPQPQHLNAELMAATGAAAARSNDPGDSHNNNKDSEETDSATASDLSDAESFSPTRQSRSGSATAGASPPTTSGSPKGGGRKNRRTFASIKQTLTRVKYVLNPQVQQRLEQIRQELAREQQQQQQQGEGEVLFYDAYYHRKTKKQTRNPRRNKPKSATTTTYSVAAPDKKRTAPPPRHICRALDVNDVHRFYWYPMVDEAVNLLDGVAPSPPSAETPDNNNNHNNNHNHDNGYDASCVTPSSSNLDTMSDSELSLSCQSNSATLTAEQVRARKAGEEKKRRLAGAAAKVPAARGRLKSPPSSENSFLSDMSKHSSLKKESEDDQKNKAKKKASAKGALSISLPEALEDPNEASGPQQTSLPRSPSLPPLVPPTLDTSPAAVAPRAVPYDDKDALLDHLFESSSYSFAHSSDVDLFSVRVLHFPVHKGGLHYYYVACCGRENELVGAAPDTELAAAGRPEDGHQRALRRVAAAAVNTNAKFNHARASLFIVHQFLSTMRAQELRFISQQQQAQRQQPQPRQRLSAREVRRRKEELLPPARDTSGASVWAPHHPSPLLSDLATHYHHYITSLLEQEETAVSTGTAAAAATARIALPVEPGSGDGPSSGGGEEGVRPLSPSKFKKQSVTFNTTKLDVWV